MSRGLKPLDPNKQRRLSVRESLGKALARLTWRFAHPLAGWVGERNESFALGKRFAVAKLTASLSPRAKLRPRLLVTSGRLFPSPEIQVSTGKDLLIPRGRLGSKLPVAYLTPFLIISKIGCPFPLSLRRR